MFLQSINVTSPCKSRNVKVLILFHTELDNRIQENYKDMCLGQNYKSRTPLIFLRHIGSTFNM